jgi:hypothetical protein
MKECECDPEHSIAKLGHCRDCPHYRSVQLTQIDTTLSGCSLRGRHCDGTPHDFNWATYTDETMSSGVCNCGVYEIHFDMARMP